MQRYVGAVNFREHIRSTLTSCGSFVIGGSEDCCAYVWNTESGTVVSPPVDRPLYWSNPPTVLLMASCSQKCYFKKSLSTGCWHSHRSYSYGYTTRAMVIQCHGQMRISGDQVASYTDLGYRNAVCGVDFHPHDHVVAFCSFAENHGIVVYKYDHKGEVEI